MGSEKSAGSVTSQQNPHNDYTAYSKNPVQQSIVNREIVTPTGRLSLAEGASSYNKEENATYVGTKEGVMRYVGRQTTVGGKFIAGGTVMEGANKPSSETSPEAQARFQALKAAEESVEAGKAQRELAAKKIAANRAAARGGVVLGGEELARENVFSEQVAGAEAYSKSLKEREAFEATRTHVLNPALVGLNPNIDEREAKIISERLSGKNYPDFPVFEFTKVDKTETLPVLVMPSRDELDQQIKAWNELKRQEKILNEGGKAELERQLAVEGFQTESENQLFALPVVGGGLKWFEEGVSGTQKYFASHDVFGREKDVVSSSFSSALLSTANIVKPSTWVSMAKTTGVIAEEAVNAPQQFFKRIGTGVGIVVKSEETAFKTNPAEATATVLGTAAGFYVLSGGKPFEFLKSTKNANAVEEAIVREGKPLSVSQGLVIGEETSKGLAVRVKAVKTVLGETGLKEVPIDATFLGTVKESAGKQADAFIRMNRDAVKNQGGGFKVLSVEKTTSSVLQTESEAVATRKGLRVELKGSGTNVFTRVKGAPNTMFTSVGEVTGEGVVNIPKSKWLLNVGSKKNFPNALEKISVRGKDIPFKLEYVSTSGGGIVEGARLDADFANVGKNVVDASTGKARQELFVNARTTNTPVKMVSAMQDFINRNPKLLRLSVGAKETFPKPLEYIKSKMKDYGKPSTEESVFRLTELGEKNGKEFYSGHGRVYPNEPIAKPLRLGERTLERVSYSKSYFFGKVKRLVTNKDNFNGGANNRPLSNSGGGASVDVNVGGGSKQVMVMNLSEAGGKSKAPRVFAVPVGVSEVQIRGAASKAVSDFYGKAAVRSSALGIAATKAVTTPAMVSRNAFNTSNRSGTMQFTRTDTRSSAQPVTRVSSKNGVETLTRESTSSRAATRLFNVGGTNTRAFTNTGTGTETRVGSGTALRTAANTLTRTATRTVTLTRTATLTRFVPVTPPGGGGGGGGGGGVIIPKGDVLDIERKRKRLPSKFFLKVKSVKTGRAPLSDLFNLNVTELAIRGKAHSPSVKTANKFFERSGGLIIPTQEQIRSKFRF
jgi:hypothetical protein